MCHISVPISGGNGFSQETIFYIQQARNDMMPGAAIFSFNQARQMPCDRCPGRDSWTKRLCNQPSSDKRFTGLRLISASFASQGALSKRTYVRITHPVT